MDFRNQFGNNGDDQQDDQGSSNPRKGKKLYHRHSSHQIQQLEAFFKECPNPDEKQRAELGNQLGLEPNQVKFWFQNKRTQTKTQNARENYSTLRTENERIQLENNAIQEALKNVLCHDCGGPPPGQGRESSLKQLKLQNSQLKEEHERLSSLVSRYISSNFPSGSTSLIPRTALNIGDHQQNPAPMPPPNANETAEMERALMVASAANAFDELMRLLRMDGPLWTPSSAGPTLHRSVYEGIVFGRANYLRNASSSARFESSKDSGIIVMDAKRLVDMFLDSSQWADFFPTIVTEARTIEVIENGASETRHGSLQLMYGKMHVVSPLVPAREFKFLRHCRHTEEGTWVVVDVSYDSSKDTFYPTHNCWRLPSGCIIQSLPNKCSQVTWVEHQHADDKIQTHKLYRDFMCNTSNKPYGAKKWIAMLQRMGEREITYFSKLPDPGAPTSGLGAVIASAAGRRGIMKLSHRMMKGFGEMLSTAGNLDFPQLAEANSSGVRVSVQQNTDAGQPIGLVVTTSTSFWLPLPPHTVFKSITNEESRIQWDVLSRGCAVHEIARVSTTALPENYISIRRPFLPVEDNMVVLQESFVDASGCMMIVYAPIDLAGVDAATSGQDTSELPILPSGIVVSGDGRAAAGGSLLTLAMQILVSDSLNMESVTTANALISSTAQKIRAALNCAADSEPVIHV